MVRKEVEYNEEDRTFIFECPHCSTIIQVELNQTNCCIFRCGQYKMNGLQIPPHLSKESCDRLVSGGLIYGCSKPFKFFKDVEKPYVEECDYI